MFRGIICIYCRKGFFSSLEILLNKIGRDVISEIMLRISEVLFYSYNSCCSLCAMVDDDGYFWCLVWNGIFFLFLCVSLCKDVVCLNGNAYATWKTLLKFSFCLIRIWIFFLLQSCLCVSPIQSVHVGVAIYACIKPITSSDEIFKAIFHSFCDAVDIEQTRRIFIFCLLRDHMSTYTFPRSKKKTQTELTSFFAFSPKKKQLVHAMMVPLALLWYSVNSLHRVLFIPEYYSCFWMGNWLIFFIGFGKFSV